MPLSVLRRLFRRADAGPAFVVEEQLLRGEDPSGCPRASILHFSMHKAATQYTKSILRRAAQANGLVHAQFAEYAFFRDGFPYLHTLSAGQMAPYSHVFRPRGYLYSVWAGMLDGVPDLDSYRLVLTVRDPRDALTSEFYSVAYSHKPPRAGDKLSAFLERREYARQRGIDSYVLRESKRVLAVYQKYLDTLLARHPVHVARYEDMIADFPAWLDGLLAHCGLPIDAVLRRELLDEAERSRPGREDVHSHVRQVTPGDHRRKLRPETIRELDALFAPVLGRFGYSSEAGAAEVAPG